MNLADINFKIGSVNPSGISSEVYFIPKQDIDAWPTINNDFENASGVNEYAQYTGSFTLKSGKKWKRLYTTQGKGKITSEMTGETDCKVPVNKASLSYPKITNEIRAFAKYAANGDFVFAIKHDGKIFIIGSPDYRTTVTTNFDSGDAAGSAKGGTIELECPDVTPLPTYVGSIVCDDATISATNFSVTYDSNGATSGTAPTDSSSPYSAGSTVTVLGNTGTLAKTSYTFGGWNTKADGSGTTYAASSTFTIMEDVTLYAKWDEA